MNKWFSLPRMGKDTFSDIMRAKVKYDIKFGFMFTSSTNIERALGILSSALNEQVVMTAACFICGGPLTSDGSLEDGTLTTICPTCQGNDDALDLYRLRFARLMESL